LLERKVLITSRSFGTVGDEPKKYLEEHGSKLIFPNSTDLMDDESFIKVLSEFNAVILGNDKITEKVLQNCPSLKLICKHGTGIDNIDLEAARNKGVKVTNVPATNADAVADVTFALMLDVARRVSFAATTVKKGEWSKITGVDVCFKTLGLIGFGAIGQKVAKRAKGFGMRVMAYDTLVKNAPIDLDIEMATFENVIKNADFLSIHVPLNDKTRNLVSYKEMSMMKKGSFIINTARGGIVDEDALFENLISGHLRGAGLDVTEKEPPVDNRLLILENVTILPHMASHSMEAINAVSMACAKNIVNFFDGKDLENQIQ